MAKIGKRRRTIEAVPVTTPPVRQPRPSLVMAGDERGVYGEYEPVRDVRQ